MNGRQSVGVFKVHLGKRGLVEYGHQDIVRHPNQKPSNLYMARLPILTTLRYVGRLRAPWPQQTTPLLHLRGIPLVESVIFHPVQVYSVYFRLSFLPAVSPKDPSKCPVTLEPTHETRYDHLVRAQLVSSLFQKIGTRLRLVVTQWSR